MVVRINVTDTLYGCVLDAPPGALAPGDLVVVEKFPIRGLVARGRGTGERATGRLHTISWAAESAPRCTVIPVLWSGHPPVHLTPPPIEERVPSKLPEAFKVLGHAIAFVRSAVANLGASQIYRDYGGIGWIPTWIGQHQISDVHERIVEERRRQIRERLAERAEARRNFIACEDQHEP